MCYLLGKRDTPTRLQPARLSRLAVPARPAAPCPPGLAREARAEREGARRGPAGTLADGLKSRRGVVAGLGAALLILQSTNVFLCCGGGRSMPPTLAPRFVPVVKFLFPLYRWGRRGAERGGNLLSEEIGRKALDPMLQLPGPSPRAAVLLPGGAAPGTASPCPAPLPSARACAPGGGERAGLKTTWLEGIK